MSRKLLFPCALLGTTLAMASVLVNRAQAHCDGLDGPVVKAAARALATGNVNAVLIWVQPDDGEAVTKTFRKALAVRRLGPEAQELADLHFFETVVRLHRAGEGAPYTGLKPAGRDLGPVIPAVDKALETGSAEGLLKLPPTAAPHVTADTMVRELVGRYPQTRAVIEERGIDYCCGGGQSLSDAAKKHGLELPALVAALTKTLQTRAVRAEPSQRNWYAAPRS